MSLPFPKWPCGRGVPVGVSGWREAAACVAEALCCEIPQLWNWRTPGVALLLESRELWLICVRCWTLRRTESAEGRSWRAGWELDGVRSPPGRLLSVTLPLSHSLLSLPERHRKLRKVFFLQLLSGRCGGRFAALLGLPQCLWVAKAEYLTWWPFTPRYLLKDYKFL